MSDVSIDRRSLLAAAAALSVGGAALTGLAMTAQAAPATAGYGAKAGAYVGTSWAR